MREEFRIFDKFITGKGLRHTPQREKILEVFLSVETHVSCEQLYGLVRTKDPSIGYTTVYRTMKLLSESGLCGEINLGDGIVKFEHKYGHAHHDHLVCTKCGSLIEVANPRIEKLQDDMATQHGFVATSHVLEIFGVCRKCAGAQK
jgi:Fur family ferric uptake transcriptional regulator